MSAITATLRQQLDGASAGERESHRLAWMLNAAVAAGVVCRLAQYLGRVSYWHDESYLVLNVTALPYRQLVGALPHAQSAPPVFLIAQKALSDALGAHEFVLRALPLSLGCAAVILMAVLSRRLLGPVGAACGVTLFALSDRLIWHAAEAKQYSGDVFVALLLLLTATRPATTEFRRLGVTSLLAAAALWVSHPVAFVFAGIALAMLPAFLRRGGDDGAGPRRVASFALLCLPALLSFVALYFVSIRYQQDPRLFTYWVEDFPGWSRPWTVPLWLVMRPLELGRYSYSFGGEVVAVLAIVGTRCMWRGGRRQLLGILLAPAGLVLLAAMAHRYPFGGSRVTVFLAPAVLLLASAGVEQIFSQLAQTKWQPLVRAGAVALLLAGLVPATYHLVVPRHRGHIRPAVEFVRAHRAAPEPVYVIGDPSPFLCYWRETGLPIEVRIEDVPRIADDRFWLVAATGSRHGQRQVDDVLARIVPAKGAPTESVTYRGGAAYRFGSSGIH